MAVALSSAASVTWIVPNTYGEYCFRNSKCVNIAGFSPGEDNIRSFPPMFGVNVSHFMKFRGGDPGFEGHRQSHPNQKQRVLQSAHKLDLGLTKNFFFNLRDRLMLCPRFQSLETIEFMLQEIA